MKETYKITEIQFDKLLKLRSVLDILNPDMGKGKFNCAITFSDMEKMVLYIRDSSACTQVHIPVVYEKSDSSIIGVYVEFTKLMYILGSYYKQSKLSTVSFTISYDKETSEVSFFISNMNDSIHIPAQIIIKEEYESLYTEANSFPHKDEKKLNFIYSFEDTSENNSMIEGFSSCFPFINDDDKKSNALALYKDKMIVRDTEHAYLIKYSYPALKEFNSPWVSIHKKTIKACLLLSINKIPFSIEKAEDGRMLLGNDSSFLFVFMNDSIANIAPPNEEDIKNISPTTKIGDIQVKEFLEAVNFLSGFYTSSREMNPVFIEKKQDLKLIFRDSMNNTICNIERVISNIKYETEESFEVNLIINSIRKYLSQCEDETVELYFEIDKPAVILKGSESIIYLAKLVY
jgi:hypothetical protein